MLIKYVFNSIYNRAKKYLKMYLTDSRGLWVVSIFPEKNFQPGTWNNPEKHLGTRNSGF